jgi:two-component system, response regulator PdtaR
MLSARQARSLGLHGALVPLLTANGFKARIILVVEDEFLVRCGIADYLREAGFTVIETSTGDEAIALCKSDTAIDLVFTDINLDGAASGWDVGACFFVDRPKVPVLYTSGKLIEPERSVPAGMFLSKPYQHDDILSACQRLLSK